MAPQRQQGGEVHILCHYDAPFLPRQVEYVPIRGLADKRVETLTMSIPSRLSASTVSGDKFMSARRRKGSSIVAYAERAGVWSETTQAA